MLDTTEDDCGYCYICKEAWSELCDNTCLVLLNEARARAILFKERKHNELVAAQKRTALEKEFINAVKTYMPVIEDHVKKATEELEVACAIARQHGLAFNSPVSMLYQQYSSPLVNKWHDIDIEVLKVLQKYDVWELGDGYGWEHSQIC